MIKDNLTYCGDDECINYECERHQRYAGQGLNSPLNWDYFKGCPDKKVKPEKRQ